MENLHPGLADGGEKAPGEVVGKGTNGVGTDGVTANLKVFKLSFSLSVLNNQYYLFLFIYFIVQYYFKLCIFSYL